MRVFARDMAKAQALTAEVEALLLEDAETTGRVAATKRRDKPLWQQKLDGKRMRLERIDKQEVQLREFKDELLSLKAACAEVLEAADIEGAEDDRAKIHKSVSEAVASFERRVVSVQASWSEHNYAEAKTADEIGAFVTQYKDEEILQARRVLQKACLEHRRFVRGLQDVYDKMRAKETRRWGGSTAAIPLDQSLVTKQLQEWDGANPPEEFGL
jgi:hypothetical protein